MQTHAEDYRQLLCLYRHDIVYPYTQAHTYIPSPKLPVYIATHKFCSRLISTGERGKAVFLSTNSCFSFPRRPACQRKGNCYFSPFYMRTSLYVIPHDPRDPLFLSASNHFLFCLHSSLYPRFLFSSTLTLPFSHYAHHRRHKLLYKQVLSYTNG